MRSPTASFSWSLKPMVFLRGWWSNAIDCRHIGPRGYLPALPVPAGDGQRKHDVVMVLLPPGLVRVVPGLEVDLGAKGVQFVVKHLSEGDSLVPRDLVVLQEDLQRGDEVALGHPEHAAFVADRVAAVNRDADQV